MFLYCMRFGGALWGFGGFWLRSSAPTRALYRRCRSYGGGQVVDNVRLGQLVLHFRRMCILLLEDCIWVAGGRALLIVGVVFGYGGVGLCGFNCDCRVMGYL